MSSMSIPIPSSVSLCGQRNSWLLEVVFTSLLSPLPIVVTFSLNEKVFSRNKKYMAETTGSLTWPWLLVFHPQHLVIYRQEILTLNSSSYSLAYSQAPMIYWLLLVIEAKLHTWKKSNTIFCIVVQCWKSQSIFLKRGVQHKHYIVWSQSYPSEMSSLVFMVPWFRYRH